MSRAAASEQAVETDRHARRQRVELLEREQHALGERLARGRVVPDRQQLSLAAEDDLLVRDEAGQAHRVDRRTTADELREYTRWVELSSSVATTEALFKTVDFALRDVFKRDRLGWHFARQPDKLPDWRIQRRPARQNYRALHEVLQLANIAGP